MKRNFKKIKILTLFFALIFFGPILSFADTASDLRAKIDQKNNDIAALEREIASYQTELGNIANDKNTLANAIKTLNLEAKSLTANLNVTQKKIDAANLKLEGLGASIKSTSEVIISLHNALRKSIQDLAVSDKMTLAQSLASRSRIADFWHYENQRDTISKQIEIKSTELKSAKEVLVKNKSDVQSVKDDLVALKSNLNDQKTIIQKNQAQKTALLKATKNKEANYVKLVADKEKQKTQLEGDLRDFESRLQYVLNPGSIPEAGSHPLAWPLDHIKVTQMFGKSVSAKRLYVSGSHDGVDFAAAVGTPVKAMASGVIVGGGNTDQTCPGASYGNWLFIKYDDGLASVFGHLSYIRGTVGERVHTGDVVAYSGATGYVTGPHLHVSLFPADAVSIQSFPSKACNGKIYTMPVAALNAYLDALQYLPQL